MTKTSLEVPKEILKAIKLACITKEMTQKDWIIEAMKAKLEDK